MQVKEYALYKGEELLAMGTKREIAEQLGVSPSTVGYYGTPVYARRTSEKRKEISKAMKYKVIVYYDNMPDSEHIFSNKNDAINELHRLRGVKYRNSRIYTVEMEEVEA